jgi:hypothetical protein
MPKNAVLTIHITKIASKSHLTESFLTGISRIRVARLRRSAELHSGFSPADVTRKELAMRI